MLQLLVFNRMHLQGLGNPVQPAVTYCKVAPSDVEAELESKMCSTRSGAAVGFAVAAVAQLLLTKHAPIE